MLELDLPELSKIDLIRLVHLSCSLLGGLVLLLIWFNTNKEVKKVEQDWGLILIAFALLLWAAMDGYRLVGLMRPGEVSVVLKTFSAYNNAFFLAALPFFQHGFSQVKRRFPFFENGINWVLIVLLSNVLVVMLYSMSWGNAEGMVRFIKYFDIVYSSLTFIALGYAITMSFSRRVQYPRAFVSLSISITIALVVTQLPFLPFVHISNYDIISLSLLVVHVGLVYVLLVLAQSWVLERRMLETEAEKASLEQAIVASLEASSTAAQVAALTAQVVELQSALEASKAQNRAGARIAELSDREQDVLKLISKSYAEIGELLFISRETVISHKKNIEAKLGISGKENLAAYARDHGFGE